VAITTLVAPPGLLQPAADVALGQSLRRARHHGVHFRRVDEVDAALEGVVELAVRFGFGVLLAPGHGAEADFADVQLAVPSCTLSMVAP
jgi:hypothetical protein